MTRKIIAINRNTGGSPLFYNISAWTDRTRLSSQEQAFGVVPTFSIWITSLINGNSIPAIPDVGWEIMDYDQDFFGLHVHKYYNSGVIIYPTATPDTSNVWTEIKITGFQRQMAVPLQEILFPQTTYPTEGGRVQQLISQGSTNYGLPGPWDAVSQVQTGSITYKVGSTTTFNNSNVYDILEQMRVDPGQPTDAGYPAPARFWFVRGIWTDEANPETIGITRVLYYFASTALPLNPIPLTDNPTGLAYYDYDTFTRADSSTTMGSAETTQAWAPLVGTWGISSNQAYLVSGAANSATVLESTIKDGTIQCNLSSIQIGMRLLFRVTSEPGNTWKWEGFLISENSTNYQLQRYQAGVLNVLGTYAVTPANGDLLQVLLSGNTITVSINGVAQTPVTDSFNNTATLHGLGGTAAGAGRFDNFNVFGVGAVYFDLVYPEDGSGITNVLPIQGPNSDPTPISWKTTVNTSGAQDGDLTKTLADNVWQSGHGYVNGDIVTSIDENDGYFKNEGGPGTSGGSPPTWNNTEGATTVDNTVTWTRRNWNSGGTSFDPSVTTLQLLSEDGGYVQANIEDVPKVTDTFNRTDNAYALGKASSGQDWTITNGVWGIQSNKAYLSSGSGIAYAYIDAKVSTCIVQTTFSGSSLLNGRLLFRYRDARNLWYLMADTTSYKVIKRVAGVETTVITQATTPVAGDVVKMSLEESLIKFYLNGVFQASATDTFNQGASIHGIGTGGPLNIRFDDFLVWQTDETIAFGFGTTTSVTSFSQIAFGWVTDATRHAQPVESGVLKSTGIGYSAGDTLKVAVRPTNQGGNIVYLVQYYYNSALVYTSAAHPTPSTAAPFYAQGAIYDRGATISNVVMKRFTYGIYQDPTSIGMFGVLPANKTLVREDLDSQAKRVAYKQGFFSLHSRPITPVTLVTLTEYNAGTRIILNNSKLGWTNKILVVPDVTKNWSISLSQPEYHLTVGDSEIEWGDDVPAGFLLETNLNTRSEPLPPTSLLPTSGVRDGAQTVTENFSWTVVEGARYVDIQLKIAGGSWQTPVRFSASPSSGIIHTLLAGTPYLARARTVDYNDNASAYGPAIPFTTIIIPRPTAPTITSITQGHDRIRGYYVLVTVNKTNPGDDASHGGHIYHSTATGPPYPFDYALPPGTAFPVTIGFVNMNVGDTFFTVATIVDSYDVESLYSSPEQSITITQAPPPAPSIATPIPFGHNQNSYISHPVVSTGGGDVSGGGYIVWTAGTDGIGTPPPHVEVIPPGSTFPYTGNDPVDVNVTYTFVAYVVDGLGQISPASVARTLRIGNSPPLGQTPTGGWANGVWSPLGEQILAGWLPIGPAVNSDFSIIADASGNDNSTSLKIISIPSATNKAIQSPAFSCKPGQTYYFRWAGKSSAAALVTGKLEIQPQTWDGLEADAPVSVGARLQVGTTQTLGLNFPSPVLEGVITIPATATQFVFIYTGINGTLGSQNTTFSYPIFKLQESSNSIGAGAILDNNLGTLVDPTKYNWDIQTNPFKFFDNATHYRGQLNYAGGVSDVISFISANPTSATDMIVGSNVSRLWFKDGTAGGGANGYIFNNASGNGASIVLAEAILGTTATDGFVYLGSCAGTPTGVPTTWTGTTPLVYDSTNNKLYAYYSAAWNQIAGDLASYIMKSIIVAKGDLIAGTGAAAVARLPIGADNTVLVGASAATTGMKWTSSLTMAGGASFGGDVTVDASGGTTGTPRILGLTNLGAARLQIGDQFTSLQSANGDRFQFQAYHGIEIWGARATTGSTVAFVAGGGTADPSLNVFGSQAGTPVMAVTAASAQSTYIQEWRNSGGTRLSAVDQNGNFVFGSTIVVGSRKTGWTAATGTATRTTFATGSVTLSVLAEHVKALIDDLISHGLIGT